MSTILGKWTIDWGKFGQHYAVRSLDELVSSTMPEVPGIPFQRPVDDFSAVYDDALVRCGPYLRIIPYGGSQDLISPVVQDGDLFVFVHQRLDYSNPLMLLEQRGWHAELCYKNDAGVAFQTAPWGDSLGNHPCNQTVDGGGHDDRIVHVFRPEFPSMSQQQADALKQQVRAWRRVFNKHRFPRDGEQFPASPWFFDPADFATVADLEVLAKALVCRSPNDFPNVPEVTCVQWSYEVLCLALNVPLTAENLGRLGIRGDYDRHWAASLGTPPATICGLGRLPFVPYSPAEVLQAFPEHVRERCLALGVGQEPSGRRLVETATQDITSSRSYRVRRGVFRGNPGVGGHFPTAGRARTTAVPFRDADLLLLRSPAAPTGRPRSLVQVRRHGRPRAIRRAHRLTIASITERFLEWERRKGCQLPEW